MLVLLAGNAAGRTDELVRAFEREPDIELETVTDEAAVIGRLTARAFDAVVAELEPGTTAGLELIRRIRQTRPQLPIVAIAPDATADRAVACMRAGATDFLPRHVQPAALAAILRRMLGDVPLREQLAQLRRRRGARAKDFLIGDHPRLEAVRAFAERIARVPNATVLITGEAGTGKRLVANSIHALSGTDRPIVEIICSAREPALLELEPRAGGAAAGERPRGRSLLESAAGGTLFLAEIDSLPLDAQARLLEFLDSNPVRPVAGGAPERPVRLIAAATRDLWPAVREGRFRPDLLYRLDVASMHLPPLREMRDVICELAGHFAAESAARFRRPRPALAESAGEQLRAYHWPGNVRELRNAVERAMIFHETGPLAIHPPNGSAEAESATGVLMPPGLTLEEVERRYLLAALRGFEGDYASLAARLGISRKTLWDKRRRLGPSTVADTTGATPRSA